MGRRVDFREWRRDYRRRQGGAAQKPLRSTDHYQVSVAQNLPLLADALVIDDNSIQAAQVLDHHIAADRLDDRVFAADGAVGDAQLILFRLADGYRARWQFKFA